MATIGAIGDDFPICFFPSAERWPVVYSTAASAVDIFLFNPIYLVADLHAMYRSQSPAAAASGCCPIVRRARVQQVRARICVNPEVSFILGTARMMKSSRVTYRR